MEGRCRSVVDAASTMRAASASPIAAVVGGGLCGLAVAAEFASRGYGVLMLDASGEPGSAPASSAAAGLLDPLTPKGKLMWRGIDAFTSSLKMLDAAASPYRKTGTLHVPRGQKDASVLCESVSRIAKEVSSQFGIAYVNPSSDAVLEMTASDQTLGSSIESSPPVLSQLAPGARLPFGALYCQAGMVVDVRRYLRLLWAHIKTLSPTSMWCHQRAISDTRLLAHKFDHVRDPPARQLCLPFSCLCQYRAQGIVNGYNSPARRL